MMAVQTFDFAKDHIRFSSKVSMLMKGTSDDDSPIPGFLYREIKDLSFESPAYCELLLKFLVKRLSKESCHVKFKTLKLMKYLVDEGDPSFRKGLHRKCGSIQEATKFSGPVDSLHGIVPYQAVRQVAKELSETLSERNMEREGSPQDPHKVQVQNTVGMGSWTPSSGGGVIYGFGNTPPVKKTVGGTIRAGLEKMVDQIGETSGQRQAALIAQLDKNQSGDYVPPVMALQPSVATSRPPPPSPVKKVIPKSYAPGRAGGGWDDVIDPVQTHNSTTLSEEQDELADRLEAVSVTDWSAEDQLVKDYLFVDNTTQFFLLRPSQLKVFKQKCQDMNCEKVVEFISEHLKSTENHVLVRAMLLLETFLLRNGAVCLDVLVTVCQNQLNHLVHSSSDQRVVDKAAKIIKILEVYSSHPKILMDSR